MAPKGKRLHVHYSEAPCKAMGFAPSLTTPLIIHLFVLTPNSIIGLWNHSIKYECSNYWYLIIKYRKALAVYIWDELLYRILI